MSTDYVDHGDPCMSVSILASFVGMFPQMNVQRDIDTAAKSGNFIFHYPKH